MVERTDHGVQSVEDELLVKRLVDEKIPLTIYPLSNIKLKVFDDTKKNSLKQLLDSSVMVTINSDDPAYFGGYLNANYLAVTDAFHLDQKDIYKIMCNGFEASFIEEEKRQLFIKQLDAYWKESS
ncbi:unnamed protein product [Didymodactylos carnosus]|uniref:Adenosine deaminase domain-containing protein n=1 Tax=Didymodactylos carnosus TaxID=1234261 RepID=A0A814B3G0_9BILA|nr:unnamed protein product [Didymodactylos carnosus]CAF3701373.1 unnamed protein product [Didymodactylos carnosus]